MTNNSSLNHSIYRDSNFFNRFFKHANVSERINQLIQKELFTIDIAGKSFKGRDIYTVNVGKGDNSVLLWSQMHGDEPTGTMALFDLLNFLEVDDEHNELRRRILENCNIYIVPMLNPDGAEVFERRNAQGIDINRDFLALQSPEANILMKLQQEIQPQFGFNLHDQGSLWSVSGTKLSAAISLLAPPVDGLNSQPDNRVKAIQIISGMHEKLKTQIPGQIGRWLDEYEPRAVGESFQRLGVSTILIEAGSYINDFEKQYVRKLNFEILVHALEQISTGSYVNADMNEYFNIPLNTKEIFHLLIKNCRVKLGDEIIVGDIGLNYTETISDSLIRNYTIADFGDLSTWNAYEIVEANEIPLIGPFVLDSNANFIIYGKNGSVFRFVNGLLSNS